MGYKLSGKIALKNNHYYYYYYFFFFNHLHKSSSKQSNITILKESGSAYRCLTSASTFFESIFDIVILVRYIDTY